MLSDEQIRHYLELGCKVKGMGRGHIKRIKDSLDGRLTFKKPVAENLLRTAARS